MPTRSRGTKLYRTKLTAICWQRSVLPQSGLRLLDPQEKAVNRRLQEREFYPQMANIV